MGTPPRQLHTTVTAFITTPLSSPRHHRRPIESASISSSPDPLSLSRNSILNSPLKANTASASAPPSPHKHHLILDTPTSDAHHHRQASTSPWRVHVVVESTDLVGATGMVREGLRSGDVRTEIVPLRGDGGGGVRRRRELSPRKRTPTPKGQSATPKSSSKSGVVSGDERENGKHVSSKKKSIAGKERPVMKEKKKDFTKLTPLYKKAAQLDAQRAKITNPESPLNNDSSVVDVLQPTKGRIATPRRAGFLQSRPTSALSLPQHEPEVDLSDTDGHDFSEMEYDDEHEPAADRPDSRTGVVDDTSMLDQSALGNEEFTMVSIESLRQQNRGDMAQKAITGECTHEQSSSGVPTGRRQASISNPVVSDAIPSSNSPIYTHDHHVPCSSVRGVGVTDVFAGFGVDSRRQLRGGLQLGQDLASIDQGRIQAAHENLVHYPRLPTPADSTSSTNVRNQNSYNEKVVLDTAIMSTYDMMSWQAANTAALSEKIMQSPSMNDQVPDLQLYDVSDIGQTQLLEAGFDGERQNVRRQVLDANTSQVIILSSSVNGSSRIEDNMPEDTANDPNPTSETRLAGQRDCLMLHPDGTAQDDWQDQVDRSIAAYAQDIVYDDESMAKTPSLKKLFTTDDKPMRAKIPRTWRRQSGVGFSYSDEVEEAMSDSQPAMLGVQEPGTGIPQFVHRQQMEDDEADLQQDVSSPASVHVENVARGSEMREDQTSHRITNTIAEASAVDGDNGGTISEALQPRHPTLHSPSYGSKNTLSPSLPGNSTISHLHTTSMAETQSPVLEEPSDIRQLQIELTAATPGRNTRRAELGVARLRKRKLIQSERDDEPAWQGPGSENREQNFNRLAPRRKYMRLLGSSPPSQSRSQSRSREHDRRSEAQITPTFARRSEGERHSANASLPTCDNAERPPTFLNTLLSYIPFLRSSAPASAAAERLGAIPAPPPTLYLPAWTHNHFGLLDKIYTLSLAAQTSPAALSRLDSRFPAFSSPPMLPPAFADLMSITLHPHGVDADGVWRFSRPVCERWCRVARAFCVEAARERGGVPFVLATAGEQAEADVDADDEEDDGGPSSSRHVAGVGRRRIPRRVECAWGLAAEGPRRVVEKICALWAAQARRVDRGRKRIVRVEGCEDD